MYFLNGAWTHLTWDLTKCTSPCITNHVIICTDIGMAPSWSQASICWNGNSLSVILKNEMSDSCERTWTQYRLYVSLLNLDLSNNPKCMVYIINTEYFIALISTHDLVTSYGDIDMGHHWFRQWLAGWQYGAITWPNGQWQSGGWNSQ